MKGDTDDELRERLWELIRRNAINEVENFLDSHQYLDLNIGMKFLPNFWECDLLLHHAFKFDDRVVSALLNARADLSSRCLYDRTALICVASRLDLKRESLDILKQRFSNSKGWETYVRLRDKGGWTALHHLALDCDSSDLIFALADERANLTIKDKLGQTPFDLLVKCEDWLVASELGKILWADRYNKWTCSSEIMPDCTWINIQSTALIQSHIIRSWSQDGNYHEKLQILNRITPEFRSNRNPNDPVGGSGRDSTCFSTTLNGADFMSMTFPYMSTELIGLIERRKQIYRRVVEGFRGCADDNFNVIGLQCQSTLDEYCHPYLNKVILKGRNKNQVILRYQQKTSPEKNPYALRILVVPQLWIWKLDKKLFIAYHSRHANNLEAQIVLRKDDNIEDHLGKLFPSTSCADLYLGLVISEYVSKYDCSSASGPIDPVFSMFERSVYDLSAEVLDYTNRRALDANGKDNERDLILRIGGIREELYMMKSVLLEQEQVWRQFIQARLPKFWNRDTDRFECPPGATGDILEIIKILERPQTQFAASKQFIASIDASAERVQGYVTLLLDVNSKHTSLEYARAATSMNAAVIVFTIVTVIFTPMAFLCSLLALPTSYFQSHQKSSTLDNGDPFYDSSYIRNWMIIIDFTSLAVTAGLTWVVLKLVTDFSLRHILRIIKDRVKKRLDHLAKALRKEKDPQKTSDASAMTDSDEEEEEQEVVEQVMTTAKSRQKMNGIRQRLSTTTMFPSKVREISPQQSQPC